MILFDRRGITEMWVGGNDYEGIVKNPNITTRGKKKTKHKQNIKQSLKKNIGCINEPLAQSDAHIPS